MFKSYSKMFHRSLLFLLADMFEPLPNTTTQTKAYVLKFCKYTHMNVCFISVVQLRIHFFRREGRRGQQTLI